MNQTKTDAQEISDLRADALRHAMDAAGLRNECLHLMKAIEIAEQHIAYGRYDAASKVLHAAAHTHRALAP